MAMSYNLDPILPSNDQISKAEAYKPLVIGYHNGAVVRLTDVADVVDSQQTLRQAGFLNGKPSVNMLVWRQPGANIITTVDLVKASLPKLELPCLPGGIGMRPSSRTPHHPRLGFRYRTDTPHFRVARHWSSVYLFAQRARHADSRRRGAGISDWHLRGDVFVQFLARQSLASWRSAIAQRLQMSLMTPCRSDGKRITRHLEAASDAHRSCPPGRAQEIGFTGFLHQRVTD